MKRFLIAAVTMAVLAVLALATSAVLIGSFPWSTKTF